MFRLVALVFLVLGVAGCVNRPAGRATDDQIATVSYRDSGPASLTLYTVVNNRTNDGAHTALLINASERVIFDPAGSFRAEVVPERGDVLYGITPAVEQAYRSAHARSTYRVEMQTIQVTPAQAEAAYRAAVTNGRVMGGFCASATANILRQVPGFEDIRTTLFPRKLQAQFASLPGVEFEQYFEDDSDDLAEGLAKADARLKAQYGG